MANKKQTLPPLVFETSEEFLPVKLTEEERHQRAQQAAEQVKFAQQHRSEAAALKQQAKDAEETGKAATIESERLLGVFRLGHEQRKVACETLVDDMTGELVKYRTDTGEELARRKPNEHDQLRIDAKRQRSLTFDMDAARRQKVETAAQAKQEQVAQQ